MRKRFDQDARCEHGPVRRAPDPYSTLLGSGGSGVGCPAGFHAEAQGAKRTSKVYPVDRRWRWSGKDERGPSGGRAVAAEADRTSNAYFAARPRSRALRATRAELPRSILRWRRAACAVRRDGRRCSAPAALGGWRRGGALRDPVCARRRTSRWIRPRLRRGGSPACRSADCAIAIQFHRRHDTLCCICLSPMHDLRSSHDAGIEACAKVGNSPRRRQ